LIAGPAIVLGGIINGFIGFNFSGDPRNNIYYGIAVAVILVVVLGLLAWKRWSKRKQSKIDRSTAPERSSKDSYGLNLVPGSNDIR
jgi:undecaprenyl pyrophosphate phosphatase UppP